MTTISLAKGSKKRPMISKKGTSRKATSYLVFFLGFVLLVVIINLVFLLAWYAGTSGSKHDQLPIVSNPTSNSSSSAENEEKPIVIAHVVSLIKCNKQGMTTGFIDAAAVLRHSIHKQSIHNPSSGSKYSYQMYAIIHTDCKQYGADDGVLSKLGYKVLVRDSPILRDDMDEGWYKDHVEAENCCGSKEFIKLYAYTLEDHPISIHWDMDVAILQPMDDLFDAMLHDKDSSEGKNARSKLQLQHSSSIRPLPDNINAYFTRDITSSQPWEKVQGVQGGFLIAKPNATIIDQYVKFIKKGNFKRGRGDGSGWDGLGYGGFQGSMAYQGVVAYYYDIIAPNTAVELNVCIWNQVVADVIWRGPNGIEYNNTCRDHHQRIISKYPENAPSTEGNVCQDCRILPVSETKTVHYTACKKPWECTVPHPRVPRNPAQKYRLSHLTNITTCMSLFKEWFKLRHEFEQSVANLYPNTYKPATADGNFEKESFLGYCAGRGRYIPMVPLPTDGATGNNDQGGTEDEIFDIEKLYGV